jgi:hypothetical protein
MENNQSTPKPEQDSYFAGFILRGTDEEIKQVKQYILTETGAKLLYQKKDKAYLVLKKACDNEEKTHSESHSTAPESSDLNMNGIK